MKVQDRINLFIKKFGFEPKAFEVCPKWAYCSCNKCKLHKNYAKLKSDVLDKQRKCKCPKKVRMEIGTHFRLKNMGLSIKELEGVKLSIQINKQSSITQVNKLKTPKTALSTDSFHKTSNNNASSPLGASVQSKLKVMEK